MAELAGRVAVVTGASAGIGEAVALDLAGKGAAVVINARRRERLEALAQRIEQAGGACALVAGDCAEDRTVEALLDAARERFGREADLVVANAGRGLAGSVCDSDRSQWEQMLRTNVLGVALLVRQAAERMKRAIEQSGQAPLARPYDIVVMGSNVGKHVSPFSSMYGSTKFAVGAIAEGARRELGPLGVRVTLIAPGIVRSEFQQVAGYSKEWAASFFERFAPVLAPQDVARVVSFVVAQPAHVHVNDVTLRPTKQDYP